ncbi:hypothetical protein [Pseudoduganella umbonata]|uniref:Uncharacterized protein n=1 Tax=Pseudoduganella umbonata TaxID=864828 RepID=A0A4P8HQT6_9BURK|nr:hypothetical protein [Pseudoduganella umbonata]MBB3222531.1 hypothetical protein [Pseudoduganella umbonata]QCP10938.1 hypothetical protein FCL38_11290 [Pseudoduganella umbonata]
MSSLSPLGTRQYQNSALAGSTQQPARGNSAVAQTAAGKASSNVALSSGAVDLQQRIDALGNDTIDLAQNFLGKFAQQLLGDSAKGATIAFDSVSLDTSSTFAAGTLRSEGAEGVSKASAFSLNESSHFLGKGTITLADGSKYDFEVEVQYEASMTAGFAGSEQARPAEQDAAKGLPTFEFPEIDWPGSLGDLFKLMDKQVSGDVKDGDNGGILGNLSVRLMQLVKNTQSLDTYAPPSPVKAYQVESGTESPFGPATDKTQMPIKVPTEPAAEPVAEAPAAGPADVPIVKSAGDIPLTISTTPPKGDAA